MQESAFVEEDDSLDATPMIAGVLEQCDVACLLYDRTDAGSFSVAATMMVSHAAAQYYNLYTAPLFRMPLIP